MGHEVIIFGCIEGADPGRLQVHNAAVLTALPDDDEWPWLVRSMFALPAAWPRGTYRSHVIHFGASLKDEPQNRTCWETWLGKFETLLRQMCWWSATLHLKTEFEPDRVFRWFPSPASVERMLAEPSEGVREWERSIAFLTEKTTEPSTAPGRPRD